MKQNLAGKSILIIEDYPTMRKAVRDMLYTLGADTIFETENGTNALTAMSKNAFDVVLCDYSLGTGKNGQQILEEARYRKLLPLRSIFIIISAEQATGMVLGAMDGKPDDYLAKPFNAQQLSSRLQKHFERKMFLIEVEKEMEAGHYTKAIRLCDNLLALGNIKMHTHLLKLRAELAITVGDYDAASKIYHEVLAKRQLPWAKLGLGIIEFQQNNLELAIAVFEQLLREHPLIMETYDWLSKAYEASDKLTEVQTILFQAVDLSPQSILRQKKLAVTADRNGDLKTAEHAYKASVQLGKNSIHRSSSDFAGLAKVYAKNNAPEAALQTLQAMRSEFVNNPEAELRAATLEAEVYKGMGDEEAAQLALQKVLNTTQRLGSNIPKDLQLDIVKTCFLSDKAEQAEELLYGLIKTHIDDEVFLNDVRRMQSAIGMHNHSEVLIQKTKRQLIATNNKGVELYKQGKLKEALQLFEQAMTNMPDNKTILLNMLKIMVYDLKSGDLDEAAMTRAKAMLRKAQQLGVEPHKLSFLKMQFAELTRQRSTPG